MFGLSIDNLRDIKNCFVQSPQIDKALLYGSRAKGNYKSGSDIDITLIGKNLSLSNTIYPLQGKLDKLYLPYQFDISIFDKLDNPVFIEHILRVGKTLYQKPQTYPKHWQVKPLGEVLQIERGGSPRPIQKYLTTDTNGLNWIKISDATASDKYIYKTKQKITKEGLHKTKFVNIGDFILSNSMSFGRPYIMKTTGCIHDGWLVLKNKGIFELEQDFLYHLLGSPNIFKQFDNLAAGSTVRNLNIALVSAVKIPIPPLAEQQAIVKKLDALFTQIKQAKSQLEQNLQNAKDLWQSSLNQVFNNPNNDWELRKLGDEKIIKIIDGDRGKNYPTKKDFNENGFCVFMNTKNVRPDGFRFETVMFITEEKDNLMGKGKLERNDVVMTTRGTIGNLGVYNKTVEYDNIRINSGMLIFRPNQYLLSSEYLFELFRSGFIKSQIEKSVTGAAQPQLPIKTIVNFNLPIPKSVTEQKQIVKKLDAINQQTQQLTQNTQNQLKSLETLEKSLLEKAFSGELV